MTLETLKQAHLAASEPYKIKAIIVVHLNGQSAQMDEIKTYTDSQNWRIIEDACHAIGGTQPLNGQEVPIGSCAYSDIAIFSFHPVKTITTAEGGALLTNNADIAQKAEMYRNHGITRDRSHFQNANATDTVPPWYYEQQLLGLNYRLNDIQCALGVSQLNQLSQFSQRRRKLYSAYTKCLLEYKADLNLVKNNGWGNPVWHLCSILIDFNKTQKTKSNIISTLLESRISTQVHYIPVYQQPYYQQLYGSAALKGCEHYYQQQLSLPLYPTMDLKDVEFIVKTLHNSLS